MANKTINELTQITSFLKNDQLAVYDVSEDVTVKGQLKNVLKTPIEGLNTTAKNLIDAINELKQQITALPPPITPYPTILKANDVTFYDYDGTIAHSYTKEEFLALDSMPENPVHEGLVAQGWNYSLEDAKDYVSKYGKLNIGQMYTTASGATEIDIELTEGRTTPTLGICLDGTVEIDWGDESTESVSGTSLSTITNTQHSYSAPGRYTIKLNVTSGQFAIIGNTKYGSQFLWDQKTSSSSSNKVYQNAIKAIRIGKGVTSIDGCAFDSCFSLSSITIPEGVTSIKNFAFRGCSSLSSVTFPKSVTSIGIYAFNGCASLSSVTIPESVTFIDDYAFSGCYSLSSVTTPKGITSIGSNVFNNCYSLSLITIPESVTSIGKYAFQSCSSLSSVTIPGGVMSIGFYAFSNCSSLSSIIIPKGVTSIETYTFNNCSSLSSIIIPESVTSIGSNAFTYCSSLSTVTIPEGVTSIGNYAFSNCSSVAEYHLKSTTPPTFQSTALNGIPSDCIIYVPRGSLSAYQSAQYWSNYASQMVEE